MQQLIKNLVGRILGYGRCPVTGDTCWRTEVASVPYSENSGLCISTRALREVPANEIARIIFRESKGRITKDRIRYTLDEITAQIPEGCFIFPKN